MSRETLRRDLDNAAGEGLLPPGWQRIAAHVPRLLAVADKAAEVKVWLGRQDHAEDCRALWGQDEWDEDAPDADVDHPNCDCGLGNAFKILTKSLAALDALP